MQQMPALSVKNIVVMGVSGSGKSSVGSLLAERLSLPYVEGDSLHPQANVDKMAHGIPLTDEDRWPWLDLIGDELARAAGKNHGVVVTCSSLKKIYRDRMRAAVGGRLAFVYLDGTPALLESRMGARTGHFMPTSLLQSQLQTLEVPTGEPGVITVSIDQPLEAIVEEAIIALSSLERQ